MLLSKLRPQPLLFLYSVCTQYTHRQNNNYFFFYTPVPINPANYTNCGGLFLPWTNNLNFCNVYNVQAGYPSKRSKWRERDCGIINNYKCVINSTQKWISKPQYANTELVVHIIVHTHRKSFTRYKPVATATRLLPLQNMALTHTTYNIQHTCNKHTIHTRETKEQHSGLPLPHTHTHSWILKTGHRKNCD